MRTVNGLFIDWGKPDTQATLIEHGKARCLIYVGRRAEVVWPAGHAPAVAGADQ